MRHARRTATMITAHVLASGAQQALHAETSSEKELATALGAAKVTLEQGLAAASKSGRPISAKFELEKGKLQLSVYTEKGGSFSEVIVDHVTGKIAKSEKITEGDDYKDATAQAEATKGAKVSLQAATGRAVKANSGYRAVSVMPSRKDGKASADIVLMKGEDRKVVAESLQ